MGACEPAFIPGVGARCLTHEQWLIRCRCGRHYACPVGVLARVARDADRKAVRWRRIATVLAAVVTFTSTLLATQAFCARHGFLGGFNVGLVVFQFALAYRYRTMPKW